jgi:acetolactate synthase-1/2/3 large subunit
VSHWVKTSPSSQEVAADGAAAIQAANQMPGQIATLILPADTAWNPASGPAEKLPVAARPQVSDEAVDNAARALKAPGKKLLLLGGDALTADNLELAGRIAAATGCAIMSEGANARLDRGAGRVQVSRIPYVVEQALAVLDGYETMITVGARPPVAFFAYPDKPSLLSPESCKPVKLAGLEEDIPAALAALAAAVGATNTAPAEVAQSGRPDLPTGAVTPDGIAAVIGALLPEGAIVVDESVSTGRGFFPLTAGAPPHVWLNNRGGSIGYGMPVATGAAVACPDQKVVLLEGDGSGMYTVQSLWTMARENLDVTILVLANRSYRILRGELTNVGVQNPGPRAIDMLSLDRPNLDWVAMARGMGVEATCVDNLDDLAKAFRAALETQGPSLVELVF